MNPSPIEIRVFEGFEQGIGLWVPDSDLPDDPNNPGNKVSWNITVSDETVKTGKHSLKLTIDGRQDDGTIWIERNIGNVVGYTSVKGSLQFYSESESFNTLAVVVISISSENPESENDFFILGPANQISGWKTYTFNEIISGKEENLYISFGISVRWETELTYYLDDVDIVIS
ncbi:hypothetical protein JW865_00390 [Candidatus Bathyarchaeota archaeon]|nr:hypothetical protein [Candidatus Bathyarchaeota archaeon]